MPRVTMMLAAGPLAAMLTAGDSPRPMIAGSASTIAMPIAMRWAAMSDAWPAGPTVRLQGPGGPPQGKLAPALQAFLDGHADFAFLTREIAEVDLATYRQAHGGDPLVIPVAEGAWNRFGYVDPVVVVVNAANPIQSLSFRQLDSILSSTRLRGGPPITTWGEAGVARWRDKSIHIAGGRAWEGEESARALTVRRRILEPAGRRAAWRHITPMGSEANVVADIASDPYAIGFTGLGHVADARVRVLPLATHEGAEPVAPTRVAILAGRYPLTRTVDLLVARDRRGCIRPAMRSFIELMLTRGQRLLQGRDDFLPLPALIRREARRTLAASCSVGKT